jgi:hypothetical protein
LGAEGAVVDFNELLETLFPLVEGEGLLFDDLAAGNPPPRPPILPLNRHQPDGVKRAIFRLAPTGLGDVFHSFPFYFEAPLSHMPLVHLPHA